MSYKYKTNVTKNRNTESGHKNRIAKHESRITIRIRIMQDRIRIR